LINVFFTVFHALIKALQSGSDSPRRLRGFHVDVNQVEVALTWPSCSCTALIPSFLIVSVASVCLSGAPRPWPAKIPAFFAWCCSLRQTVERCILNKS